MRLRCKPKRISPGTCRLTGMFWTEIRLDPEPEWTVWQLQRKLCWIFKHIVWDLLIRHMRCGSGNMAVYASAVWCKKKKKKKDHLLWWAELHQLRVYAVLQRAVNPGTSAQIQSQWAKWNPSVIETLLYTPATAASVLQAKWVIKSIHNR